MSLERRPRRIGKTGGRSIDPMSTLFFDNLAVYHKTGMIRTMETIKKCQEEDTEIVVYKISDELTVNRSETEILRFINDPVNKRVIVNDKFIIPHVKEDYNPRKELPGSTLPNVDFNVAAIAFGYAMKRYRVETTPRITPVEE